MNNTQNTQVLSERDQRRWAAAQALLGAFITGLEQGAADREDYESAAGWRDLNRELQASTTPVNRIEVASPSIAESPIQN